MKVLTPAFGSFAAPLKPDGTPVDRSCCAVIALVNAFGVKWIEARQLCRKYGRVDNFGMSGQHFHKTISENFRVKFLGSYGSTFSAVWMQKFVGATVSTSKVHKGITLAKFIEKNPVGTFVVAITGHFTVVKNGQLADYFDCGANKRVVAVWEVC